ncbi:MAG TPA: DUF3097 family protein [Candidatus Lustribacter sp.]|nr:DUF3097 family protein [Candidatus Lustribacter sp.]
MTGTGSGGDRYGADVLGGDRRAGPRGRARDVAAEPGVVVEEAETRWCGAVVRVEKAGGMHVVHLEDRHGRVRAFPLGPGFLLDGAPVVLTAPRAASAAALAGMRAAPSRTVSGSLAVAGAPARVAVASRIYVEGRHDAELVEHVWGADLRVEGVVVEMLDGVDRLEEAIRGFGPGPGRRMGVLVDHLVPGSKESRIVEAVEARLSAREHVLVVGHPYVDVWQSVRPGRLGWSQWPTVPREVEWKRGICAALGWPHASQADLAQAWRRILRTVRSYADLEPTVLGRVEELLDFVTAAD